MKQSTRARILYLCGQIYLTSDAPVGSCIGKTDPAHNKGTWGYIMISRYFPSDLASTYPPGKQIKHMMYLLASAAVASAPQVPLHVFVRSHRQVLGEGGEMGGSRNNLYCSFLSPSPHSLPRSLPCHLYVWAFRQKANEVVGSRLTNGPSSVSWFST